MLRAIRLRAILLPLGVAIACITAVAWYGLLKIPAQQRYITDRNLRLLKTKGAQIKSKVDNFDLSIDHALEFFPQGKLKDHVYRASFEEYVREFAPGLQILHEYESEFERAMRDRAGDPPRVVIQRDEGRNFLYLGYKHDGATIVAKSDIEQVLNPFLSTGAEFDALVLVTRDGRVIAQQSASGLELVHVDALRDSSRPQRAAAGDKDKDSEPKGVFASLRSSTNIANVILGNAEYQMYIQPVQLSLNAGESDKWRVVAKGPTSPPDGDAPEEWALCGFVRADHFRAASSAISYTYLLWFGLALATVCLAIPLLKLHMLSPSERLERGDDVRVAATAFLATALIALCSIDAYYFYRVFNGITDEKLRGIAEEMRDHFNGEASAIAAQLDQFRDDDGVWRALGYGEGQNLSSFRSTVKAIPSGEDLPTTIQIRKAGNQAFQCVDPLACRDHVLSKGLGIFAYPFFDLIVFDDQAGWQRIKWSTHGVTPFINLDRTQLQYFHQLKSARLLLEARSPAAPRGGVSVIQSPNTGDIQTVFWKAFDVRMRDRDRTSNDLIGESLTSDLISLVNPVLPGHVQFAVIDETGRVMYHSDPTRRLQENLFLECDDNTALRAAVSGRRSLALGAYYLGRSYRMYATPLDLTVANLASFQDPAWTLVVFQDRNVAETLNLATLTAAVRLFGLYAVAVAIGWALLQWTGGPRLTKWFWPDRNAGRAYRIVTLVNVSLSVLFLAWIAHLDSPALFGGAMLMAAAGFLGTIAIVTRARATSDEDPDWLAAFHSARVSLLFITAAVPAIACFQVAYDFEAILLTRSGQAAVAGALEARADRIKSHADRAALCDEHAAAGSAAPSGEHCDTALADYIARRTDAGAVETRIPWDVNLLYVAWKDDEPVAGVRAKATTRFEAFLGSMHVAYNEIAADMAAVISDGAAESSATHRWRQWLETGDNTKVWLAKAPLEASTETLSSNVMRAVPSAGWWLVLLGVAAVLYFLVRVVIQPLYALSLYGRRCVGTSEVALEPFCHTLLIGPPGSGKSRRFALEPKVRVFDARIHAFVDRRVVTRPVPVERRRQVYATVGAARDFGWTEPPDPVRPSAPDSSKRGQWFDLSSLPVDRTVPIGIDHVECSLESGDDRMDMLHSLEELIYRHRRTVLIASARDPITQLLELPKGGPDAAEMARWIGLFKSFREVRVGIARTERPAMHTDPEHADMGAPYYRAVWSACSRSEQLALRQLAEEGVVNPRNEAILLQLMRSGLVHRDRTFRVMNDTFRHFVVHALTGDELCARERSDVSLPWASVTTAMLTVALGLGALLLLTSQQLVDAWVGYVPALAPAVPTVLKLFAAVRDGKQGIVNA